MKPVFLAILAFAAAGCVTYKLWAEGDSDPDRGLVRLTYEYRKYERPQVDERAAVSTARERCGDWGFKNAQRDGEETACVDGTKSDCSKWQVTRTYRCVK